MCNYFAVGGNMTCRKSGLWLLVHTAALSPEARRIAAVLILWRIPPGFASTGGMRLAGTFLNEISMP